MFRSKQLELDRVYRIIPGTTNIMWINYPEVICAHHNGEVDLIRKTGDGARDDEDDALKIEGLEVLRFLRLTRSPEYRNGELQPDRYYSREHAARLLGLTNSALSGIVERTALIPTVLDNVRLYRGSELERFSKRPTENHLYRYADMEKFIPGLTEQAFDEWATTMRAASGYRPFIGVIDGEIVLKLAAAKGCYHDFTLGRV